MRHSFIQISGYLLGLLLILSSTVTRAQEAPLSVVANATNGVITELVKTKPEQRDQAMIEKLVEAYILPAIDQQKIAMGALGKYWRRATPEEQQRFITVFRDRQLRTYGGAFKAFSGETLTYSDNIRYSPDGGRAIVSGEFKQTSGTKVPVDFKLYKTKQGEWLVYVAVIASLSIVTAYRTQLNDKLQNMSIAELLTELEEAPVEPVEPIARN